MSEKFTLAEALDMLRENTVASDMYTISALMEKMGWTLSSYDMDETTEFISYKREIVRMK